MKISVAGTSLFQKLLQHIRKFCFVFVFFTFENCLKFGSSDSGLPYLWQVCRFLALN